MVSLDGEPYPCHWYHGLYHARGSSALFIPNIFRVCVLTPQWIFLRIALTSTRLSTLGGVYHGLSSTRCRISGNGSCSLFVAPSKSSDLPCIDLTWFYFCFIRRRSLPRQSSGLAHDSFSSLTSPLSSPRYAVLRLPECIGSSADRNILRQIWFFHPIAESFGMKTWQVPFPSWTTMAYQILIFLMMEDAWHYVCAYTPSPSSCRSLTHNPLPQPTKPSTTVPSTETSTSSTTDTQPPSVSQPNSRTPSRSSSSASAPSEVPFSTATSPRTYTSSLCFCS